MVDSNSVSNGENDPMENYSEEEKKIEEELKDLLQKHQMLDEKLTTFLTEFSSDEVLDSIRDLYQFSLQSDQIEENIENIQQQFYHLIDQNKIEQTNSFERIQSDIQQLNENIQLLDQQLQQIHKNNQTQIEEEQQQQTNSTDDQSDKIKLTKLNNQQKEKKKSPIQLVLTNFKNNITNKTQETPTLSHLLIKQTSPAILDLPQPRESLSNKSENPDEEQQEDDDDENDEEMIVYLDDKTASKISHKVHFSNNIVRYLRGPFKAMVHGTMHAVDLIAQGTHISDAALQAVKKGVEKQQQIQMDESNKKNSIPPTFTEIGSDWIIEGENADRGYSSPSIWMRDPTNRRILAKIQEHPLCAANEWLAFVLGKFLGLPVNEVQISVYQNNLVSLHLDVANEDEKTTSFMDLPKQQRKELLVDPIMERMDIFDRIIQNVDRNQQNILITYPKTMNIDDHDVKLRVHLIDHSNCFGMGKLNGISLVASKFHSHHLAVVKFDPIHKSKQFEQYLNKLPVEDRPLISKTLNRFSRITNEQFDYWINQISDLLSSSQYNRIYGVLNRQRDIAKRYINQWGLSPRSSSIKLQSLDGEELVTRL